eukprot:1460097-Pyramimonas_sp.AAC.1
MDTNYPFAAISTADTGDAARLLPDAYCSSDRNAPRRCATRRATHAHLLPTHQIHQQDWRPHAPELHRSTGYAHAKPATRPT